MLLAIDSGNTNAVFAVYDGDMLRASWRVSTNARRTADEYAVWLTQLMALAELARTDIDAQGSLLLDTAAGMRRISAGEVFPPLR